MIRRHATALRLSLALVDFVVAVAVFVGVSVIRFGPGWSGSWETAATNPWLLAVVYAANWVAILWLLGLYRLRARWAWRTEVLDLLRAVLIIAILTFATLFVVKLPDVSRLFLVGLFAAQAVVAVASRGLLRFLLRRAREGGRNTRFVLVVGDGPAAHEYARRIERYPYLGLRIAGFLADPGPDDPRPGAPAGAGTPRLRAADPALGTLGRIDEIDGVLRSTVVDEVAICLAAGGRRLRRAHRPALRGAGPRRPHPPVRRDQRRSRRSSGGLRRDPHPVARLRPGPDAGPRREAAHRHRRRAWPHSSCSRPCSSVSRDRDPPGRTGADPLPPGPRRAPRPAVPSSSSSGRWSPTPRVVGTISSSGTRSSGHAFKVTDDPRVTRVGRFLRRASLDEIPQFWNVIRGDMSIVGPRPPLPDEVAAYDVWHRRRLAMKPGITGLWQVSARRDEDFDRWVRIDLDYIDRWSLWLDLRIMRAHGPGDAPGPLRLATLGG